MRNRARKSESLGSYLPNAFLLHVNTHEELHQWKDWEPKLQCTYLHEYIHFLQDLSTLNGLYNIYCIGEYIQDAVVNQIYPHGEGDIIVPILPQPGENNVYNNCLVNSLIMGLDPEETDDVLCTLQITGKASISSNIIDVNGAPLDVHQVSVPYNHGEAFLLGETQISESMAYIGEWLAYGEDREPSPAYPYCVVEQLAAYYNADLAKNYPLLFALCDLSLSFSNPAKALVTFFEKIEQDGCPAEDKTREYIRNLIGNLKTLQFGLMADSYANCLLQYAQLTIRSLNHRFSGLEHCDLRNWYQRSINYLISLRIKNPTFMLDLVESGAINNNCHYQSLLREVGTPLITNNAGEVYQETDSKNVIGEKRMAIYTAAMSIYEALNGVTFECELVDYCRKLGHCVDEGCKREPWKKARPLFPCPYGRLWYAWKLRKFTLKHGPIL